MMLLGKVLFAVRRLVGADDADLLRLLAATDRFRKVLERERARTDRTGERLSLAAFTPRAPEQGRAAAVCLARIFRGRLRTTDEAGWLHDGQIGVVLPSTPAAGAWKVVADVCLNWPDHLAPLACAVYTYPFDPTGDGNGSAEEAGGLDGEPDRRVTGLEALFLQPMPWWKRGLDILGAVVGLIVLAPALALLALAVRLSSPGPVLFRQLRSGRGGKPFVMYKFRSMIVDAEARRPELLARNEQDGPAFKIKDDPRVTLVGRFLRRTSLDELPQLWNVLRGEMSLVGPRPLPCGETAACETWQRQRLDVTPGLTCIWQVKGRSKVSFDEWVRMDVQYIRRRSLTQDLMLLLQTVPAVMLRKGAH